MNTIKTEQEQKTEIRREQENKEKKIWHYRRTR